MSETLAYDNLIAGSQHPIVNRPGTVAVGISVVRGTLLGLKTSTGKWTELADGDIASFSDIGICSEDVDATLADVVTTLYVEGEFNDHEVVFFYSDTAADWINICAGHGIYLRKVVLTTGASS